MPVVQDAQVALSGQIIALEAKQKFVEGQRTDEVSDYRVTVIAGDGIAIVKLTVEQAAQLAPVTGDRVAWSVRCVPYAVDSNSGMTVKFVRLLDLGDVDLLGSVVQDTANHKSSAKAA